MAEFGMLDNETRSKVIAHGLACLNIHDDVCDYDLLQGGISGSYTYRVQLPDRAVILKAALATQAGH